VPGQAHRDQRDMPERMHRRFLGPPRCPSTAWATPILARRGRHMHREGSVGLPLDEIDLDPSSPSSSADPLVCDTRPPAHLMILDLRRQRSSQAWWARLVPPRARRDTATERNNRPAPYVIIRLQNPFQCEAPRIYARTVASQP
jgi:hypothetical protein